MPRPSSYLMSRYLFFVLFVLSWLLVVVAGNVQAQEQKSRYVTLVYAEMKDVQEFNSKLQLNRTLESAIHQKNVITAADEVLAKVDIIIEKVQVVLDLKFPIFLFTRFGKQGII